MGRNTKTVWGALSSTNLLGFDPAELVLVTDESSPLYDKRVHLPLDEAMVENMLVLGVLEPITVKRDTETGKIEVVIGRQRVKAARAANERLRAAGRPVINIPAHIVKTDDPLTLAGMIVSENENRQPDTPLGRAEKMVRLQQYGADVDRLAVFFGCSTQTVKSTLALLDCCATVRKAVEAGKVGVGHAVKLSKLEPDEQRERVARLLEVATPGHAGVREKRAIVHDGPRMKTKREVTAERDASEGERKAALDWVLGSIKELS